jgi:mRNA interferase MazF
VSQVRPWQVWLADFGQTIGSEQGDVRPVVVVASDLHCRFPIDMTLVVPVTSKDRGLPHHVPVSSAESGLDRPSWARTEDITAISTRRITIGRPLGQLTQAERLAVSRWIGRMVAVP